MTAFQILADLAWLLAAGTAALLVAVAAIASQALRREQGWAWVAGTRLAAAASIAFPAAALAALLAFAHLSVERPEAAAPQVQTRHAARTN